MKPLVAFFSLALMMQASVIWTAESDHRLHVPDGFVIEKVAGDPQIVFPMFAAFDDRGRLYVAESSGLDLYQELQAQTRRCRVRRLEDRDGDGKFESSQVFADQLVFPMGLCWRAGRLYVADSPDLVTYEDVDGDGRAERREVILTGFGHQDNGSLHGLVFGPDGLLYMTMGQPDGYRLRRPDGTNLTGRSGALIRCRPDGSDPEVLCRGFENLVEVVFTPQGEMIGTDNWFQKPVGGLRDALVDLAPGGLYPRLLEDEGTLHPVTGRPLPAISLFPAVALSGLARYEGGTWGDAFQGQLFSAQHNSRRVQRHELTRVGSTFASREFDFVTTDDPDFHPSDVLQDADGSLLVIDTGGWYVQHCPTGRIRNSRAPGGIYRVRQAGPAMRAGPDSSRPAASPGSRDLLAQQRALWELARREDPSSLQTLRQALEDPDGDMIATAARALALRRDTQCAGKLCQLLSASQPHVRRAAAEALARCARADALPALLDALTKQPDHFLEHALVHAVYRIATRQQLRAALAHPLPAVQRCALVLLDHHPHRAARSEDVVTRLGAADEALEETALSILLRHPEWAEDAQELLRRWLDAPALADVQRAALPGLIVAFQSQPAMQQLVGDKLREPEVPHDRRILLLRALGQCSLAQLPRSWIDGLAAAVGDSTASIQHAAVETAARLQIQQLDAVLIDLVENPDAPTPLRVEALGAVVVRHQILADSSFNLLVRLLDDGKNPLDRLAATEVLGRAELSDSQLTVTLSRAPADPLVWPQLLPAFRNSSSPELGFALVHRLLQLAESQIFRPSPSDVLATLRTYPQGVLDEAADLLDKLRHSTADQEARLAECESLARGGDVERGRMVFFGKEVACSACHRVGTDGGNVGPDLTRIGAVRSPRDLIESIVVPSSTFAQGYENYLVVTSDGRVASGVIASQSADTLVLHGASGKAQRFQKAHVEEMTRQAVSIMPDGLDRKLTSKQFQDLLTFLQSLK